MPRRTTGRDLLAEAHLVRRIGLEREQRGWSYEKLARETEKAGCKIHATALWKIEKGDPPRRVTVDELVVLSMVFRVSMAKLVIDPEILISDHLAQLAEQAVGAAVDLNRLEGEMASASAEWARTMTALREGLADRPEQAEELLERFEALRPPSYVADPERNLTWWRDAARDDRVLAGHPVSKCTGCEIARAIYVYPRKSQP